MSDTTIQEDQNLEVPTTQEENKQPETAKEYNFRALEKAKALSDKKAQELEAKLKAKEESEMVEAGKYKELADAKSKEADDVKTQLKNLELDLQLQSEIMVSGVNPKFSKFVQEELKKAVKNDSETDVKNHLQLLKSEYPEFFQAQTITGLSSGGTTATTQGISVAKIGDMSTADYMANRDKIKDSWQGVKLQ